MRRSIHIALLFSLLFSFSCASAQPREYTTKSKKAIKSYEAALKAYATYNPETGMPDFKNTEANLNKAIKSDPNFIEAYIMLSQVSMDQGNNQAAIKYLNKSIELNPNFFPNSFYFLAKIEFAEGQYEEAKSHLERYLTFPRIPEDFKSGATRLQASCIYAIQLKKNPVPFTLVNLGPGVNTERPEYFPTITADDNMLLFTRDVKDANAPLGGHQEDFFFSIKRGGQWTTSRNISTRINTRYNEGAPSLSADGQTLIFTACELADSYGDYRDGFGSCDLFITQRRGSDWTVPANMGEMVNTSVWESQPSYSADGKTIYFVRATRGRDGKRTADIWFTTMNKFGNWDRPMRLSDVINTDGNEASVLIHPDGQTLYFSSDGHPGMGGLDIYMSRKQADGSWGKPINLGYPINTHNDENSLLVSSDGKMAFMASDRPGGFGELDLYSFELPAQFRPQQTTYLKGTVFNIVTKELLEAKFELIDLHSGEVLVQSFSNATNGEFLIAIATNRDYALNVSKDGYAFYSRNFSLAEKKDQTEPFMMDIPLVPIGNETASTLDNVFFDLDKTTLRPESRIELDKLVDFLKKNPTLKIEIRGHTDNRGDKKHNLDLSNGRARSVMDYLIGKGIAANRLTAKGFGDTLLLIADAKTEEEHQKNRRTEYVVLK